jgi:dipeptidase
MRCTTVLVGAKASHDGSTMIARTDDGHFDVKKIIVVEPEKQPRNYESKISHLRIPLPENPMRYTACPSVDRKDGIWAATGINAANVGMTATETITSNARVLGADPLVKEGIGEEDLVTIVLPYIHSAREGVVRLGHLLEKYGTYEMNGVGFQDVSEIWWMETIGGHHWIAKRVPDDEYVVMPNHIHAILDVQEQGLKTDLPVVIGQYKMAVTKRIRSEKPGFQVWQRSFHDHVIRNRKSYEKIWTYIENNPAKWEEDCFYIASE